MVVFDLDGTLIDSTPQIITAANAALNGRGTVKPEHIGPPLVTMLSTASGLEASDDYILQAASIFTSIYDPIASQAQPFDAVTHTLTSLSYSLHLGLATNKRTYPTELICIANGWTSLFDAGIRCVEDFKRIDPQHPKKSSALTDLAFHLNIDPAFCAMVGDTQSDYQAAIEAGYRLFLFCPWGSQTHLDDLRHPVTSFFKCHSVKDFMMLTAS